MFGWFNRAHVALIHDTFMAAVAFAAAILLRYGWDAFDQVRDLLLIGTPVSALVAALVFRTTGLYRGIWRYASLDDILAILRAATLVVLIATLILFIAMRGADLPRSSIVIAWILLVLLLGVPRLLYRVLKDGHIRQILRRSNEASRVPVLLVGASDEAENFIREMSRDANGLYRVVGIIDDKNRRAGQAIRGVQIYGGIEEIPALVEQLKRRHVPPQRIIVARERIEKAAMARLLDIAESSGLTLARMPRVTDFKGGEVAVQPRPVDIEDLLNRPQTALDREQVEQLVAGRRVLVTGAGGSIGGELVRQLAQLGPARLVLVDHSEFALYGIDMEMSERFPAVPRAAVMCDVRDRPHLARLFATERPELVFHAAAMKHVPLAEANPEECVLTNVVGTRHVAELSLEHRVTAMVMISTDKAVNPTNVMGATKRLAESYAQALDLGSHGSGTAFVTVRFGNVLGSTGSVVPLFQRQLRAGGPLTVTHPDMTRYFMTIREAVELVLQASALGTSEGSVAGKIYVLDMGEPVKIVDLARQLIRLAGLRPDKDVRIEFTGLRPGEKLYEELFHAGEELAPTPTEGVMLAASRTGDAATLARTLDEIEAVARQRRRPELLALLIRLVPEFHPAEISRAS